MPMMTITVQGTEAPKPGKKRGRIKSETGMLFQANPELIEKVSMGMAYEIAYKDEKFGDVSYRVVEAIYPAPISGGPTRAPTAAPRATPMPATAPEYSKDMHIFVCGAYNNALANPSIDPFGLTTSDKLKFVTEQMEIYRLTLGRKPEDRIETGNRQSFKDEMNDEIPGF